MRKVISTLSIAVLMCSIAVAQFSTKHAIPSNVLPSHVKPVSSSEVNALKNDGQSRVAQAIICDYDAFDENFATGPGGGTYERFVWSINMNYPVDPAASFNMRWAAIVYDTIVDPNTGQGYSMSTTPYTVDSIFFYANHERDAGSTSTDSIRVIVYEYTGSAGILINSNSDLTNTVIWDTILTTTTDLTPAGQLGEFVVVPDAAGLATINAALGQGTKFTLGVEFYGDTINKFNLLGGYADYCGGACFAEASVVGLNSFYHLIAFTGTGVDLSGVNSVGYDCDQDGTVGTAGSCEEFPVQNWAVAPAMTIDPPFLADGQAAETTGCPNDVVSFAANVSGAIGTPDIEWTGPGNIVSPYTDQTDIVLPDTNGTVYFYIRAIDNGGATPDTIYDSVSINVRGLSVSLGNDTTIACASTLNLVASVSGSTSGATFAWNDGSAGITYLNATPGTYSITATNNSGCTATDSKVVSQPITQTVSFEAISYFNEDTTTSQTTLRPCEDVLVQFNNTSSNLSGWTWTWDFGKNDGSTNGAVSPSTTYSSTGIFTVTLTADSAGCIAEATPVTLTVLPASNASCVGVGINEADWLKEFVSIYPNPNAGTFVVDFSSINNENVSITVFNLVGQAVYTHDGFSVNNSAIETVNLNDMGNGFYFVRVQVGNDAFVTKVSVQK